MSIEFKIEENVKTIYNNDKLIETHKEQTKIIIYYNDEIIDEIEKNSDKCFYFDKCNRADKFEEELILLDSNDIPINLYVTCSFSSKNNKVSFVNFVKKDNQTVHVRIPLFFYFEEWNKPFFITDFIKFYKENLIHLGYTVEEFKDVESIDLNVERSLKNGTIFEIIEKIALELKEIEEKIVFKLINTESENFFVRVFNFPKGYEYICSQYLMSFGEFLSNLGVDTSVSVDNFEEKTILKVDSLNNQILKDIELAFYTYISMPYIKNLPALQSEFDANNTINPLLNTQIEFFKTQIKMKDSIIEMNEYTISNLETENLILKKQNNDNNMTLINSLEENRDLKKITLFNDSITIDELKKGPLAINPKKFVEGISKINIINLWKKNK